MPSAASVLRRALLIWGAGHLALGERRGWLLVMAQPVAILALALSAALLIETTRWLVVLLLLALVLVVWLLQALDAHRRAQLAGGAPGGEMQVAALLPLAVVLLGGFWLVGGDLGSPAATLQRYVSAWQSDRPENAVALLAEPPDPTALGADWQSQREQLRLLVAGAAARYGAQSGLDAGVPFNSLRFEEVPLSRAGGRTIVNVDLVRRERYETELFGLIPTAAQRTVLVQRLGNVHLAARPAPSPEWLPSWLVAPARIWLIEDVSLDLSP
jgi:hypothetical protein